MKLFDIAPSYEQAMLILAQMEEDGCHQDEIDEAMRMIEQIEGTLNDKCLNIASWIRNLEAEAKAIKDAQDAMDKRRKSAQAKADRLRAFLLTGMKIAGVNKISFPHFVLSVKQNPESVKIAEGAPLPPEYLRYKEPEPDKTAIKAALKEGKVIPGCILERGESLSIK